MSDETTLPSCPFCGGESFVRIDTSLRLTQSRYRVGCDKDPSCHGWYGHSRYYATEAEAIAAWNTRAELGSEINGETSDGYHTFNELYHHRAVLFSVIVRDHRELAWKARKHHDGTMYEGMFIVGIETPKGHATYHYDLDPYWGMFDCEEREFAPEWDGHTPDNAIARIAELGSGTCELKQASWDDGQCTWGCICSACDAHFEHEIGTGYNFCPNCGRKVVSA